MMTEERPSTPQAGPHEHLDAAQDETSGEAAPSPAQRNAPALARGEAGRTRGTGATGEADQPAAGRG